MAFKRPQALNRYNYVQNNPLKWTDPTGHNDVRPEDKPEGGGNTGGSSGSGGNGSGGNSASTNSVVGSSSISDIVKPIVSNPKLQNYVDQYYKGINDPKRIGNGTTADAVKNELKTNTPTNGKWHLEKGQGLLKGLSKWVRKNLDASASDRSVASQMLQELRDAFRRK